MEQQVAVVVGVYRLDDVKTFFDLSLVQVVDTGLSQEGVYLSRVSTQTKLEKTTNDKV